MTWSGIDDLDVVRRLDVAGRDRAFAFLAQHQRDFVTVVQAEDDALQVQHDVNDVFLDAVDGRVLVQHAGDRHFGRRIAHHRRQQHATQRVAERVAVAALERLERDLGAVAAERLDVDGFGFEKICLHEVCSFQYPRLVTPIRLMDQRPRRGRDRTRENGEQRTALDSAAMLAENARRPPFAAWTVRRRHGRKLNQREYNSTISASLMSAPNSSRSGDFLNTPSSLARVDLHPVRHALRFGQLDGIGDAQLLLRLVAHRDDVTGLHQVRRDVDDIHRSR